MVRIRFPPAVSLGTRAGPHGGGGGTTRKQGRLLDRALRGAPSLKPGVSKPFRIEQSQPTRQQLGVEAVGFKDTSPTREGPKVCGLCAVAIRGHTRRSPACLGPRFLNVAGKPAISCSSSPSVATGEPRKPPLRVLHEELLPLPSTDGALQLRNRWFAPARVKGLSAVADERCRTDKLDGVIKRRSSRKTTMVGREATLDGRLFLGGTDRRYGAGGETSYLGVKRKSGGTVTR